MPAPGRESTATPPSCASTMCLTIGEAEARAGARPRRLAAVEALEHVRQVLGRDADAGVVHDDLDLVAGALDPDGDDRVAAGVQQRVVDEVAEHHLEQPRRHRHAQAAGGDARRGRGCAGAPARRRSATTASAAAPASARSPPARPCRGRARPAAASRRSARACCRSRPRSARPAPRARRPTAAAPASRPGRGCAPAACAARARRRPRTAAAPRGSRPRPSRRPARRRRARRPWAPAGAPRSVRRTGSSTVISRSTTARAAEHRVDQGPQRCRHRLVRERRQGRARCVAARCRRGRTDQRRHRRGLQERLARVASVALQLRPRHAAGQLLLQRERCGARSRRSRDDRGDDHHEQGDRRAAAVIVPRIRAAGARRQRPHRFFTARCQRFSPPDRAVPDADYAPTCVASVLVIEDDAVIARVMLARTCATQASTSSGPRTAQRGLRKLRYERPDVAVVDLMLPGLDGWAVTEAARRERIGTPIIAVSARGSEHDKVHTLGIGADDYLAKPFGMRELVARVQAALRRSRAGMADERGASRSRSRACASTPTSAAPSCREPTDEVRSTRAHADRVPAAAGAGAQGAGPRAHPRRAAAARLGHARTGTATARSTCACASCARSSTAASPTLRVPAHALRRRLPLRRRAEGLSGELTRRSAASWRRPASPCRAPARSNGRA